MPDADYYIRQGDAGIAITDVLRDANNAAVNIQSATVVFTMLPIHGGPPLVSASATNAQTGDGSDGSKGRVSYTWATPNTSDSGYFLGTWIVTFAGGQVQSYPNAGFLLIYLSPDAPTSVGSNYVSLEEMKSSLELQGTTYADGDLPIAISAASRGIDEACNRTFVVAIADSTRYYRPLSYDNILVDDLQSVTSVKTDNDGDGTFEITWTANTEYILEPVNASSDSWPYTRICRHPKAVREFPSYYPRSVQVVGKFGWPAVPPGIMQATRVLASKLLRRSREAPFGVVSIGLDVGATARVAVTDPDVKFLIAPFMREKP